MNQITHDYFALLNFSERVLWKKVGDLLNKKYNLVLRNDSRLVYSFVTNNLHKNWSIDQVVDEIYWYQTLRNDARFPVKDSLIYEMSQSFQPFFTSNGLRQFSNQILVPLFRIQEYHLGSPFSTNITSNVPIVLVSERNTTVENMSSNSIGSDRNGLP